jgi:cytoskeletal protein RodZ
MKSIRNIMALAVVALVVFAMVLAIWLPVAAAPAAPAGFTDTPQPPEDTEEPPPEPTKEPPPEPTKKPPPEKTKVPPPDPTQPTDPTPTVVIEITVPVPTPVPQVTPQVPQTGGVLSGSIVMWLALIAAMVGLSLLLARQLAR